MEGVGARLGRSSSRYVPATVFTGPVRKWKKKWVHAQQSNLNHHAAANRAVNGINTASRLLFYKWTPITSSLNKDSYNDNDGSNGSNIGNDDSNASNKEEYAAAEEPQKKKFKYIPIVVLEEQKNESSQQIEDDANPTETDASPIEATSKSDGHDEKPDINDETQVPENNSVDLNESTLDLSLRLKEDDGENEPDPKADRVEDNQLE